MTLFCFLSKLKGEEFSSQLSGVFHRMCFQYSWTEHMELFPQICSRVSRRARPWGAGWWSCWRRRWRVEWCWVRGFCQWGWGRGSWASSSPSRTDTPQLKQIISWIRQQWWQSCYLFECVSSELLGTQLWRCPSLSASGRHHSLHLPSSEQETSSQQKCS